jgi:3-phenylpropionate/trans-cinnamate dioxygenase ferredoxin reductase subunit
MAGLTAGFDHVVTRGDATSSTFSAYYFKAGKLIAIDSLNQPGDHMSGRKLLDKGVSPTPEQAADTTFDPGSLLV